MLMASLPPSLRLRWILERERMVYWRLKKAEVFRGRGSPGRAKRKEEAKAGRSRPFLGPQCRSGQQPADRSKDLALAMDHPGRTMERASDPPRFLHWLSPQRLLVSAFPIFSGSFLTSASSPSSSGNLFSVV
jgi:hypothetical protein